MSIYPIAFGWSVAAGSCAMAAFILARFCFNAFRSPTQTAGDGPIIGGSGGFALGLGGFAIFLLRQAWMAEWLVMLVTEVAIAIVARCFWNGWKRSRQPVESD